MGPDDLHMGVGPPAVHVEGFVLCRDGVVRGVAIECGQHRVPILAQLVQKGVNKLVPKKM